MININNICLIDGEYRIHHFPSIYEYESWIFRYCQDKDDKEQLNNYFKDFILNERILEKEHNLVEGSLSGIYHIFGTNLRSREALSNSHILAALIGRHTVDIVANMPAQQKITCIRTKNYTVTVLLILTPLVIDNTVMKINIISH